MGAPMAVSVTTVKSRKLGRRLLDAAKKGDATETKVEQC